jgi:sugar fermentation stimulation protein A
MLVERFGSKRKTAYDLTLVEVDGCWVSVDARLPNDLVEEALRRNRLPQLAGYASIRREVAHGGSRLDFMLQGENRPSCLLEVKSITLVLDDLGCFPDAVTQRGRRHVHELADAIEDGYRAVVAFVVQREDAIGVRPHDESDPEFGQALRDAVRRGVEVYAFSCDVEPTRIEIANSLPVLLDAP